MWQAVDDVVTCRRCVGDEALGCVTPGSVGEVHPVANVARMKKNTISRIGRPRFTDIVFDSDTWQDVAAPQVLSRTQPS